MIKRNKIQDEKEEQEQQRWGRGMIEKYRNTQIQKDEGNEKGYRQKSSGEKIKKGDSNNGNRR